MWANLHPPSTFIPNSEITREKKSHRDWSNLPQEVLEGITDNLYDADYGRLRSVCKKWRSLPPLVSLLYNNLPLQIKMNLICPLFRETSRPIFLAATDVYHLKPLGHEPTNSSKSWLVSVEEINPGKLRFLLSLHCNFVQDLPQIFPKSLNLSNVEVSLKGAGLKFCYDDGDEDVFAYDYGRSSCWANYPSKNKVILGGRDSDSDSQSESDSNYSDSDCDADADSNSNSNYSDSEADDEDGGDARELENYKVLVLLINKGGLLVSLHLKTGQCTPIRYRNSYLFDDIIEYDGDMCAIDRKGRAFRIDSDTLKMTEVLAGEPTCDDCITDRRKLLAVSDNDGLYMICRVEYTFVVYKLDEFSNVWDEIYCLGDRILFVSFSECFFVKTDELPECGGNCIVFPKDCFPEYRSGECPPDDEVFECSTSKYLELVVYYMDDEGDCCEPISSYPELAELFWPPPSWTRPRSSTSDHEVGEQVKNRSYISDNALEASMERPLSSITSVYKNGEVHVTGEKFLGITVSSDLVPILRKLWEKHGNVTEGHTMRSDGLRTWAFETLAMMIMVLQSESGGSFTDSQIEYLTSSLLDLQSLHFRLDWLAPFVNRAEALHKEKEEKKRIISELESEKSKLLADLRKVVDELVQQKNLVTDQTLAVSPQLNFKDVI